jgi:hypothetical protein
MHIGGLVVAFRRKTGIDTYATFVGQQVACVKVGAANSFSPAIY